MSHPWLTVVVPTMGAAGLQRALLSIACQDGWGSENLERVEVLVVEDTVSGIRPHVRQLAERYGARWIPYAGHRHCWGQPQRNAGMFAANGKWLAWLGDDDVFAEGAFETIRAAIRDHGDARPLLFRVKMNQHRGTLVWCTKGDLALCNVDAECIVTPNDPARLGRWTMEFNGDFAFIRDTAAAFGGVEWIDEVIAITRPNPGEDWTASSRRWRTRRGGLDGIIAPLANPNRAIREHVPVRLNFGCGAYPLAGFVNVDSSRDSAADVLMAVPPILFPGGSASEVWACHFLEHLSKPDADEFLREAYRVLTPGGRLGIVVPDTRAIMRAWLDGDRRPVEYPAGCFWDTGDLDDVCAMFLYSTVQESHHKWMYDEVTLRRAIEDAGFAIVGTIDRYHDSRLGTGQWYQFGYEAIKPKED